MRIFCVGIAALLLVGCAGKQGVRVADPYETATIDQMVGNNVSGAVFARTIVCLNARRETRFVTTLTNQSVTLATNVSLSYFTNQTVTISTNQTVTWATNDVPVVLTVVPTTESETNAPAAPLPVTPPTTNVAVTTASNVTQSRAANQTVTTASAQLQRSRQTTITTNHLSITAAENQNISAETNLVVTVFTNVSVSAVTNVAIVLTNQPVHDYFVWVEFTTPMDFALQPGESLVLLVDGVRHSLSATTTPSVLVPRRGFSASLYRVHPQLLVDIANAREVKIRLKGGNSVIERQMSSGSRQNFKKFLVKYFQPEDITPTHSIEARRVVASSEPNS